jgi:hypothetical protein
MTVSVLTGDDGVSEYHKIVKDTAKEDINRQARFYQAIARQSKAVQKEEALAMKIEKSEAKGSVAAEQAKARRFGNEEAAAEQSASIAIERGNAGLTATVGKATATPVAQQEQLTELKNGGAGARVKAAASQRLAEKAAREGSDQIDWTKAREQGAEQMKTVALEVLMIPAMCVRVYVDIAKLIYFSGKECA